MVGPHPFLLIIVGALEMFDISCFRFHRVDIHPTYLTWDIYVGYNCGERIYGSAKFGDFFELLHMLTYDNDVTSKFMVCENMGIFLKNPHISHHINIPRKVYFEFINHACRTIKICDTVLGQFTV